VGKVLVVTSGKGGVGKTTATANLGSGLALAGRKVVLIDADIGLRNLDLVMGLENRIVFDLVDVMEKKCRSYRQAMIKDKRFPNLFLMPAAQSREKEAVKPEQMVQLCNELRKSFDFILIDCPAGIEHGFRNAIAGADEAIIVTNPEVSAVRDADRVIGLLDASDKANYWLLLNRVKSDQVRKGNMLSIDDVKEILSIEMLGIIPEDERILNASNRGEPVILDQASRAGAAYRQIVKRLQDPSLPMEEIPENGSVWSKVLGLFSKDKLLSLGRKN